MNTNYLTYEIVDDAGNVRYVGIGQRGKASIELVAVENERSLCAFFDCQDVIELERHAGRHPAEITFSRRKALESELCAWLCSLGDAMPQYRTLIGPVSKSVAEACKAERQRELRAAGIVLLSNYYHSKLLPKSRAVFHPQHGRFVSVNAAGRALECSPSLISRYCKAGNKGWSYVEGKEG